MRFVTPLWQFGRRNLRPSLVCLASILACQTASAWPINFLVEQIATTGLNPQVSGQHVVWEAPGGSDGGTDREIFSYQNGVTTQLTANAIHDLNPRVSSAGALWERNTGNNAEVVYHNGVSETQLTNNAVREQSISMSDQRAAWMTGSGFGLDVVSWDYTNPPANITGPLLPANTADTQPNVRGGTTVWKRGSSPNFSVMKYDGTSVSTVATSTLNMDDPTSEGDLVAWEGFKNTTTNGREIYLHDGSQVVPITDNDHPDFDPQISGGKITWWGGTFNNNQVFLWDNGVTTTLSNSGLNQFPKTDGQLIVWQGWEGFGGGDLEIFLWDGSEVHQLTDNDYDDTMPQLSGNHIVWSAAGGVWHTTVTVVPEPGSLALGAIGLAALAIAAVGRRRQAPNLR